MTNYHIYKLKDHNLVYQITIGDARTPSEAVERFTPKKDDEGTFVISSENRRPIMKFAIEQKTEKRFL